MSVTSFKSLFLTRLKPNLAPLWFDMFWLLTNRSWEKGLYDPKFCFLLLSIYSYTPLSIRLLKLWLSLLNPSLACLEVTGLLSYYMVIRLSSRVFVSWSTGLEYLLLVRSILVNFQFLVECVIAMFFLSWEESKVI